MAKCSKCGSPLCKCGSPNHYGDSPAKHVGFGMANNDMAQLKQQQQQIAQQQIAQPDVQPMTNIPPAPSSAINPFSPQAQAAAQGIFGTTPMMQKAINAPAMYKDGSPLEGNAFIAAKIAAEKAGKSSFKVGGKTFPVK